MVDPLPPKLTVLPWRIIDAAIETIIVKRWTTMPRQTVMMRSGPTSPADSETNQLITWIWPSSSWLNPSNIQQPFELPWCEKQSCFVVNTGPYTTVVVAISEQLLIWYWQRMSQQLWPSNRVLKTARACPLNTSGLLLKNGLTTWFWGHVCWVPHGTTMSAPHMFDIVRVSFRHCWWFLLTNHQPTSRGINQQP